MEAVGELSEKSELAVEWRINEFCSLPAEVGKYYDSPVFCFVGASWLLNIYPNGKTNIIRKDGNFSNSEGLIALYLHRRSSGPPIHLEFSLGFKTLEGKVNPEKHFEHNFEKMAGGGFYGFIKRPELLDKKSELLSSGVLTVVCKIKYPKSADISSNKATKKCSYCKSTLDADEDLSSHQQKCMDKPIMCPECSDVFALKNWYNHQCQKTGAEGNTATEKCSYCKSTLDTHEDLSSHQQKCMDKPIKCPECNDVVALKDWYGHQCQKTGAEASEKLLHDFKTMMLNGVHSDMVVKVKGEEFHLHKSILASRNPYFDSMFKTDMKEKSSGVVTIDDCETDIFRSFVYFIYTGKVDRLSSENVCSLYETADKYQEDQLKDECLQFMINTLSVDSFCDYFALALRHEAKELLQKGIAFFTNKGKEIARNVKWQTFMIEYPTQANELFIKTLDYYIS